MKGLFITATGTDVGKTVITAGILRWCRACRLRAMVMKPVQTGAARNPDGEFTAPDVDLVLAAAGLKPDTATCGHLAPCLYEPACSPHLAAELARRPVNPDAILAHARALTADGTRLIVEGAGGVLVPIGGGRTMADLMKQFGFPVVLVAHSGLGTINHVLLSLEALRTRGLNVLGVILNDTRPANDEDRFIRDDNARVIETDGKTRVLARVPHLGVPPDWAQLDAALASCAFFEESAL